ncbi:putative TonB-dependent receptor [Flavihumibacter petaseus NBRC 106054]|uniref:Putative TonB-dependent receptor n=2 Tax=Flavihumibacter TaxID=1004301 RepID=A0A0E9N890_9BACT|nr:putative TonB-dependent receptor [Flavihumibacter petaseus NBRC 106054]
MVLSLLFLGTVAFGQVRPITGQVKDANGKPVPFASVKVKGSSKGVAADADGKFTIEAAPGAVLEVTAASYEKTAVPVGESAEIGISLKSNENLSEVVVTALGVKRSKNTLPYAAQQVKGDDLTKARGTNVASALSGRISGLEIRQGNSIGGSTNVIIRGNKSLTGNNQALFVVDGVPIENAINNSANQKTGRGGFDYGNAAADINPDDIENVNVLKGAAATALYGSRASNGVVMITTKKGKRGLGITINSGLTVGSMDKSTFAKYQKQYGAGYGTSGYSKASEGSPNGAFWYFDADGDGVKDLVVPTTEDASYGAAFDPSLNVFQWDSWDRTSPNYGKAHPWVAAKSDPRDFYEDAVSNNNSIYLDGGNENGSFKLGYTRNDEHGILPNSNILRNTVNFGATYNVTSKLTAAASVNYSQIDGKGRYGTGYDDYNVNQNFRQWYETNMDIADQKRAYFESPKYYGGVYNNTTWNWADPSSPDGLVPIYTDNPYWTRYQNYETDSRRRVFGNVSLNYKVTDWLNILGRVSMDTYNETQEERVAVGSLSVSSYSLFQRNFSEMNYDLMANVDKNITDDINFKGLLGVNMRRNKITSSFNATNGGLFVPGLYAISNSVNTPSATLETSEPRAVDGYFGGVTFGWRETVSLDATFRRDRSSTLPVDNNAYNYYSVSGSYLFSKQLRDIEWLSSGKVRVNYAEVGGDAPFGAIKDAYDRPDQFGQTILYSVPGTKNNAELKPERTKSREIGLEMAFLKNRIGFDVSYYSTNTVDQIMPVSVTTATGYSSKYYNAGDVQNKGIEMSLFATPIKTRDFSWDVNVNWTKNNSKVLSLYEDAKNLQLASFQGGVSVNATVGQPFGTIQGKTWVYQDGQKVVYDAGDNAGRYKQTSSTSNVIGNVNPDWTGGIYNNFRYKNFALGFLIDVRQGGDVFSLDMYYGLATGIYAESAGLNDLGNPSRNTIANGGGVIMPGVTPDGKPNTIRVENEYGTYGYAYNPAAAFVYDASYVKLREMNLTYSLPQSIMQKIRPFKGIDVSLIGRNLWIIHKNLPYADPEENLSAGNAQGYQSGAYPTTRSLGFNVKVKF